MNNINFEKNISVSASFIRIENERIENRIRIIIWNLKFNVSSGHTDIHILIFLLDMICYSLCFHFNFLFF